MLFPRHLLPTLGLADVEVYTGRAEGRGQAAGAAGYTLPICALGGRLVAWKHGAIEAELAGATNALTRLGGR